MVKNKNRNISKPAVQKTVTTNQVIKRNVQPKTEENQSPSVPPITPPKHVPIPNIARTPELFFESSILFMSLGALFLNYLNLYKTFFWIPQSYTKYAMHFHLIDKGLIYFIIALLSRRFIWSILKHAVLYLVPHTYWKMVLTISRIVFIFLLGTFLCCSAYIMSSNFSVVRIIALVYPFIFYLCIYKMDLTSFLEAVPVPPTYEDNERNNRQNEIRSIYHVCSNSADSVRSEVKYLREDCNNRIALVIFQTIMCVHYTTIVPCLFAPNSLNYDSVWINIQTFFICITFLSWHLIFCFPPRYCDILHRVALHLGTWTKVESRMCPMIAHSWTESILWPQGTYVKHAKEIFRAEGITNAAQPGNSSHIRLYTLFAEPWKFQLSLASLKVLCSLLNLAFVISLHQWQQVLASGLVLAASYTAMYVILRDYLILRRVYLYETMQQGKVTN